MFLGLKLTSGQRAARRIPVPTILAAFMIERFSLDRLISYIVCKNILLNWAIRFNESIIVHRKRLPKFFLLTCLPKFSFSFSFLIWILELKNRLIQRHWAFALSFFDILAMDNNHILLFLLQKIHVHIPALLHHTWVYWKNSILPEHTFF